MRARRGATSPSCGVVEGGSTITQQVAKLLLDRGEAPAAHAAWLGEDREAVLALRLEHRFTKREILALYLNLAAYGNQIVGAERASHAYFGMRAVDADPGAGGVPGGAAAAAVRVQPVSQTGAGDWRGSGRCCARMARRGRV